MATIDQVKTALAQLDHSNDDHWADSAPRTSIVQRIANDKTITRAQIAEAMPGFARKVGDAMGEPPEQLGHTPPTQAEPVEPIAPVAEVKSHRERLTPAEHEANIVGARSEIDAAMRKQADARKEEGAARRKLDTLVSNYQRDYPPIPQAQLAKRQIENANAERAKLVAVANTPSPLDYSFTMGGKRPRDAFQSRGRRGYIENGKAVFGAPRRAF